MNGVELDLKARKTVYDVKKCANNKLCNEASNLIWMLERHWHNNKSTKISQRFKFTLFFFDFFKIKTIFRGNTSFCLFTLFRIHYCPTKLRKQRSRTSFINHKGLKNAKPSISIALKSRITFLFH